jgi:preprotein translocase subunit SecE
MALPSSGEKGGDKAGSASASSASARSASSGSVVTNTLGYFSDSFAELKRVTYPTKAETIQATVATLAIILFVSVCLFVLDLIFGRLMEVVLS